MMKPILILGFTVGGMSLVALSLITLVSGVPVNAAWTAFWVWTGEAWATSSLAYFVTWRLMRKRAGLILKLPTGVHLFGVLSIMVATAAIQMDVIFLFGGHAASNPEGTLKIFLLLVTPSLAFAVIRFVMLRIGCANLKMTRKEVLC